MTLKACPLCGSKKSFVYDDGWDCFVQCLKCGCHGGTHKTKQKAIAAWNTRPREEELLGALKDCVKQLKTCMTGLQKHANFNAVKGADIGESVLFQVFKEAIDNALRLIKQYEVEK